MELFRPVPRCIARAHRYASTMQRRLEPEDLRAFANRRWDLIARAKREFAAQRFASGGPNAARVAAQRLLERWKSLHPDAPIAAMRDADLEAHIALKRKLDRADRAFRRR